MEQSDKEATLLKHYRNIRRAAEQQLLAVNSGNPVAASEWKAQKLMIIDHLTQFQAENGIALATCSDATREILRELLEEILVSEQEIQKILAERRDAVRHKMLTARKKQIIHQGYEAGLAQGRLINIRK